MIYEVFNMNSKYYRQMMDIIIAAKVNPPKQGQVHHIVPRCWYIHYNLDVDNSISNTVLLTWEDHKLVHNLAYKCAKEMWFKRNMAYTAHMFGDTEPKYNLSEEHKRNISESHKGQIPWNKGKKWFTDGINNIQAEFCPKGFHPGLTRNKHIGV